MSDTIWWITLANVLYLASYSVHDILWLRVLTVVASLLLIPFYLMQPVPLVDAAVWSAVFIAINAYWIVRLSIERRPVRFTPDEARLKDISFPSLTPQEARALFALGKWTDAEAGTSIVKRDLISERFSVILSGSADVLVRERKVAELGDGQFIGIMDKYAQEIDLEVLARITTRTMCWPRELLNKFLASRPDVALALERSIGYELRRQLERLEAELSSLNAHPMHE